MQAVGTWAARGRRVGRLLWCAFLTFAAVLNVWFSRPRDLPESLRSFVAAGQAVRDGLNPYGLYPLVWHLVLPDGSMAWGVNLNPPLSLLLFRPLAGMNVARLGLVFYFGGLALYLLLVGLLALDTAGRRGRLPINVMLWAVVPMFLWDTLSQGQIYVPLALCSAGAWLLLRRGRFVAAGVLLGCFVAIKPNFLIWPVVLAAAGVGLPALTAGGVAALLSAIPLLIYGPLVYVRWFHVAVGSSSAAAFNISLSSTLQRFGLPALALPLSLLMLAGFVIWAWRTRPLLGELSAGALLVGILASPVGWEHYTIFALPVFFWRRERPATWIAAALLAVPAVVIWVGGQPKGLLPAIIAATGTWALLLLLADVVWGARGVVQRADVAPAPHGADFLSARERSPETGLVGEPA